MDQLAPATSNANDMVEHAYLSETIFARRGSVKGLWQYLMAYISGGRQQRVTMETNQLCITNLETVSRSRSSFL